MKRLISFASFLLLAALTGPLHSPAAALAQEKEAVRAQGSAKPAVQSGKAPSVPQKAQVKKSPAKSVKAKANKAQAEKLQGEKPKLTREELAKPYAGNTLYGPPAPPRTGADNATVPEFDPAPKARPFAKQEDSSPINFRIGAEKVVDPLTGKEVTSKPDAAGVKDSVKNMDLKGAMDKVGGKAEIQVDILKF